MKNFLLLLGILLSLPALSQNASTTFVELLEEDHKSATVKLTLDGFEAQTVQSPQGEAWTVSIENGTPILVAGAPDLPKITSSLLIGDDAAMEIMIQSVSFTDYENVEIAPSKGNLYRDTDPDSVPYEYGEFYDQDAFYPKDIVWLRDPYIYRDFRGQTAVMHPVRYNPATKVLRVYDEIIFTVVQVDGTPQNALVRASEGPIRVESEYEELYQQRFLNYTQAANRYDQVGEVGKMLIISAAQYMPAMEPFVEWKMQKGIPTEIVDIALIGNDVASITDYVGDYYNTNGLTYLLLIGDENDIVSPETNAGDACDHCYAYQAGNDHFADLFVGRFNAENIGHVQTMVDRTMNYEKAPYMDGADWFSVAAGCGSNEGPGDDGEYDYEHLNNVKIELLDYTYSKVWEFYQGSNSGDSPTPGDVTADQGGNPSTISVIQAMEEGMSLFNYTGHGNHSSVSTSGFDVDACNQLTNTTMHPFMIIVGCCVGDFTGDYGSGPCLGDAWIRATHDVTGEPTGGIAGGFASLLQSWAPPMEGQDEMMKLVTESAIYDIRHTIGGVMIHGFGSMIEEYGNGGIEMADTWNIFGDPSVTLYTAMPQNMTVDHVATTFLGSTSLTVNCDVEGAMIGLYYNDDLLATGLVEGGAVEFDFDPLSFPEPILVTATAFNRQPYQGEVEVIAASGPFVLLENYLIDDSAGDQDGKADYNEDILLNVDLSNVGVEMATAVTATLSTTDPNVVITDNTASFGDIEIDGTSSQNGAYAFSVDPYVEDGYIVNFQLEIETDGNVFNGSLNIPVYSPVLSVADEASLSDLTGGNDNGRIDPGETLTINITNLNDGQDDMPAGTGTLTTNSPYVTILNANAGFSGIDELGNEVLQYEFEVSSDVPLLEPVEFVYSVEADIFIGDATYNYLMNPIVEDFETNDFDSFEWQAAGTVPWFTTGIDPYEGDVCSQSGNIGHNQTSELILVANVLEAGTISFSRKVSSEQGWDYLRFFVNDVEFDSWSGESPWTEVEYGVQPGNNVFRWVFEKDQFVSEGADAGWVDEVILPLIETGSVGVFSLEGQLEGVEMGIMPNPLKSTGQAWIRLQEAGDVRLSIANMSGQILSTPFDGKLTAGDHVQSLDVSALAAGTYMLILQQGDKHLVRRLIVQ
ncbi:MAG: T9SS type A sorting domain-containing protein [Bacteroidetes bacterium]|nr:T9SS type A sorting domain-containing protein [Bacteroidota bacterium]